MNTAANLQMDYDMAVHYFGLKSKEAAQAEKAALVYFGKTGQELRDTGIDQVAQGKEAWINHARSIAINVAEQFGSVTINDVREFISLPVDYHPNTWGAVLRGGVFQPVGFCQATHPSAHARTVRVYKLKAQT